MLEGIFKGVGIQLDQNDDGQVEVVTPIDGSPAFKAGVQAGDIILKVNGESIEDLHIPDVIKKIGGPLGTRSPSPFATSPAKKRVSMTREEIVVPTVKGYERKQDNSWDFYVCDDPKIAYLRITQFTPETFDDLRAHARKTDRATDAGADPRSALQPRRPARSGDADRRHACRPRANDRRHQGPQPARAEAGSHRENTLPYFPMIVLVNEHSASASEIVAGSLMDNKRAVVIGERSYGKGSVQEVIPLDKKGGELKLTVAYYYLPSGRLVHRRKDATDWGVQPQIVVPMDPVTEEKVAKERYEQELFKRPVAKSVTRPTTAGSDEPARGSTDVRHSAPGRDRHDARRDRVRIAARRGVPDNVANDAHAMRSRRPSR